MPEPEYRLQLQVGLAAEGETEEVDRLTRQLLQDLEELNFGSVGLSEAAAPVGSKAAGAVTLGSLLVGLLPSAVPRLISYLQAWIKRGEGRTIKIKAATGESSFEIECPADALGAVEVEKLLAKLSNPFSTTKQAPSS